jgi:hypothetical protein
MPNNKKNFAITAAIALIIVLSLSLGEYVFSLDLIPRINHNAILNTFYGKNIPVFGGGLPLNPILSIFPPYIYQKILLFLIFFFSAYSMHTLVSTITESKTARLYAGLLYMLNPYTYIRTIVGHWFILFAYSVLPLAVKYFIDVLDRKDRKSIIKAVLVTSLVAFNSHTLFIAFLTFSIIFIFKLYKEKSISIIRPVSSAFVLFFILNTYWLIPLITAQRETILTQISTEDLTVFAPRIESFSALFTLASMHGFWRPGYIYAKDFLPFWQLLFVSILFLAVHGFISYYKHEKLGIYVKAFAVIWFIGLILAAGIRSPFAEQFRFLFDHIPLMRGMRDTHKFVTMLALSYSYLGALGLAEIEKTLEDKKPIIKKAVIFAILLIPLIYSFTFFNGFAGQIKPTDYPKDWYEVNEFLNGDKNDFKVLFFPWHQYMDFHWIPNKDKRIANPAPHFFDKDVISAKNIEVDSIYRQVYTPTQLYIDYFLKKKNEITNFGELVSIIGVKYILLTKEVDYKKYFFLFNQTDLELVLETENFYVFKNKHFKGSVFSVDGIGYIKNWDELINISKTEDITKRSYLIGSGKKEGDEGFKRLKYEKVSPVKYVIKDKPLKYIVFTEEYSKDWRLDGIEPVKAYGVVNVFESEKSTLPKEIVYERFYRICLPSYAISLITFIGCIGYLFYDRKRRTE